MDILLGPPSGDEQEPEPERVELSQGAVRRAFGLSQSALKVNETHREVAETLQQMSGASELESDADDPQIMPPTTARVSIKKDVNFIAEDENPSDYESFSSGDSDGGVIEDDDPDPERDHDDIDDDVVSDNDAVRIDEAFIQSLMLGASDQDKQAIKQRESTLRAMRWTAPLSTFEADKVAYEGMNNERRILYPSCARSVTHRYLHSSILCRSRFGSRSTRRPIGTGSSRSTDERQQFTQSRGKAGTRRCSRFDGA
jgi:hypothetical protein